MSTNKMRLPCMDDEMKTTLTASSGGVFANTGGMPYCVESIMIPGNSPIK